MSVANVSLSKWHKVAGIGLVCSLALAGCDRSEVEETDDAAETTQQEIHSINKHKRWLPTMPTTLRSV